jgi:ligand-binding sensor domain-containing protein/two-component sensor histidine kinase
MKCKLNVSFSTAARALYFASVLLICNGSAAALDNSRPLDQYTHNVWQTDNGLPQNTIRRIIQTQDGYIWIATDGGLVHFDGISFMVFDKQSTPAIKSNQIRNLYQDREGNLWICTPDGLTGMSGGKFTGYTVDDGLSSNSVWSMTEDHAGVLWIITTDGLDSYKDGKFTPHGKRDGLSSDGVETLFEDSQDTLWIGTTGGLSRYKDGVFDNYDKVAGIPTDVHVMCENKGGGIWIGAATGLYLLKDGRLSAYTAKDGLSAPSVESIVQDSAGRLWIGTANGLDRFENGKITALTVSDGLPSNHVQSIYPDREGALWICTETGLARLQNDRITEFSAKDSLSSLTVLSICEDREGGIWLGTESGGMHLLKDSKFVTYTTDDGLSNDLVRSVYQDRKGNVWIGTSGGGLDLIKDGQITSFGTKEGLSSNVVLALCSDRDNDLWVGTPGGLNRLRNGRFTTYTSADGLTDDFIRSIYEDRSGTIWIGTRRGLTKYRDGKFTACTTLDGLPNDYIGAILEDSKGSIWISTLGGLSRFKDGTFTNYTIKEGLSSNVVTSLYEDRAGNLWIGTNGSGLNRFADGKFTTYTTKNGLFDDVIHQILEDGHGNLWLSCDKGVFSVSVSDLDDFAIGRTNSIGSASYGTADGMKIRECNGGGHPAGWKTQDGRLWFSTLKGVAVIDPDNIKLNQLPPPVVIEEVLADDRVLPRTEKLELSPGLTRFAFHYAGLSFVAPEKVQFKYKLEGFDKDWIVSGSRRVAYYTNIPPGKYVFRVIACNNDGVWNDLGAGFSFYLKPHFYQTYWFYAVCLAALGLIGWQLYLLRVKRIESQFSAVLAERNRIAREIHDTLTQGLTGISLQLELVAKRMPVSTEAAKPHLDQARMLARENLADARRSIWDLRSQALENSDLPTSLSQAARRLTASTGTQAQLQVSGAYRRLSETVESNLLRIGQEAVNNAVKHARAGRIDIALQFDPDLVRMCVRDDGLGFEAEKAPASRDGHFGLLGMRERAEQIGGKLIVSSVPGEGTEVSVEVPLVN